MRKGSKGTNYGRGGIRTEIEKQRDDEDTNRENNMRREEENRNREKKIKMGRRMERGGEEIGNRELNISREQKESGGGE
jgi:hypothetical protein